VNAYRNVVKVLQKSNVPKTALLAAAPWSYSIRDPVRPPPRHETWLAIFEHKVGIETILAWKKGYRKMPQWARDTLAAHLRREAMERLRIADELSPLVQNVVQNPSRE
jgi:hypothetical protein